MDLNGRRNTYFHRFMLLFPVLRHDWKATPSSNRSTGFFTPRNPERVSAASRRNQAWLRKGGVSEQPMFQAFWVSFIGMWTTKCWVGGFKLYGYVRLLIWLRVYIYTQYMVTVLLLISLLLLLLLTTTTTTTTSTTNTGTGIQGHPKHTRMDHDMMTQLAP